MVCGVSVGGLGGHVVSKKKSIKEEMAEAKRSKRTEIYVFHEDGRVGFATKDPISPSFAKSVLREAADICVFEEIKERLKPYLKDGQVLPPSNLGKMQ